MKLEDFNSIAQAREWCEERTRAWNLLQPLEGNHGWDYLVAKAKGDALRLSLDMQAIDLTEPNADRQLIGQHAEWRAKTQLVTLLDDARKANQEAIQLLTQVVKWEKEHGHA